MRIRKFTACLSVGLLSALFSISPGAAAQVTTTPIRTVTVDCISDKSVNANPGDLIEIHFTDDCSSLWILESLQKSDWSSGRGFFDYVSDNGVGKLFDYGDWFQFQGNDAKTAVITLKLRASNYENTQDLNTVGQVLGELCQITSKPLPDVKITWAGPVEG